MRFQKIISILSAICWVWLIVFGILLLLMAIENAVAFGIIWMLLGGVLMFSFALEIRRQRQKGSFDFYYFLAVQRGYIFVFIGLLGLAMFAVGALRFFVPQMAEELAGRYGMYYAGFLVFLFWAALILMFLGFALNFFSEFIGYWRLKKSKNAAFALALGGVWLSFMLICCSLFMDVIDENLFRLAANTQNWLLVFFGLATVIVGLFAGRYEDLNALSNEDEASGE